MTDADQQALGLSLLQRAIAASGLSASRYAREVLIRDERTIRRWLTGESPIPQAVLDYLRAPPATDTP